MTELLQKFRKIVFRQQVCHNQYWLHTDYKSESIKIIKKKEAYDEEFKISAASVVLYQNSKILSKS